MEPILKDLPMPIRTPRLILRPPRVGEGKVLNAAVLNSFETLHQIFPWAKEKPTLEESEVFVRLSAANWILKKNADPYLPLFIFDHQENLLGSTGFINIDWDVPCLGIGYWLSHQYTGQGIITEAVNAQVQYAVKELGVKRIAITCDVANLRSKKVAERLGFKLEGTFKANRVQPITTNISDTLIFAKYDLQNMPELKVDWGK